MPFAPLVTVVTTVTVAVAATLAVTAQRDLVVPYARRSPAFKSVVTHHRPPSSGATCVQGQRWLTPCRACLCTEKGVLRCRSLPCSPTGRSPIVVDGLVIPPHLNMRAGSAYTDHALHSKKGESAERAHPAAEPSVIDSSEPDSGSASDSDSDSESAPDSQEDADALSEGDYSQDSEASSRSFTRKSMRSLTEFNRAPPVQQLPDPDLDVICNYWLQNQPKGRGDGDYSFDDGDPTLAANLRDLEHRSYQNPRRAPPVQQLPEPTVDEICQKWLETKLPRKPSSLSQKPTSLQTQRAANGDKYPMTSSPVHSPPRSPNNNNQPLLFLYRIHQTARSSRNMPPILTPDYNFPSFYPISYNPYPQLPTRPPYCPFYTKELPSAASTHRSPLGYSPLPLPLRPPMAPRPTPVVPLLPPPPPPPPPPAPVPPPPTRAVPCNANPPATNSRDVRGLKPEIHNVNDADHFKLHPNAISVPVRRRRSAVEEGRTAYSPKDHLRFPKFGSPVKYVSEYSRVQSISHNQASQPIQDLENSRIVLPMVRKK